MKVLYSCLSKSWGGLEMGIVQDAEQLIKKGFTVDFLCYPGSQINIDANKRGINCLTLKASGYFHPVQALKLSSFIKKNKYQIIHTHLSKDLWILAPSLKLTQSRVPLLLTKQMGSFVVKKDFLHKLLYNRVNFILAISREIEKNVLETCPVTENKVLLHHNSVDLKKFNPSLVDPKKIRKEFEINENEILIGMIARITNGKGHEEFLYAANKLIRLYDNLRFLIVGKSSPDEIGYEEKIKKLSQNYGFKNKVIFTGFRSDTPDMLAALDIFVFPSHSEAFGNALVEAMAMEKPSVAARYGGVLDIAEENVTGYLFNRRDGDDLADKLKLLIGSPEKRIEMGRRARDRVIENFDVEKQTEKLIALYKKLSA